MNDQNIFNALNEQMNFERESAEIYADIAIAFGDVDLEGTKTYFHEHADEERGHAYRIRDYLLDQGFRPTLSQLPGVDPFPVFDNRLEMMKRAMLFALEHERKVTDRIKSLYIQATEVQEIESLVFLQWFVTEQIEEEQGLVAIINQLSVGLSADDGVVVLMMDERLGKHG